MTVCVELPLGPACLDITGVRAGDRNEFTMTITQSGVPLDLTDLTLSAQARRKALDAEFVQAVITILDAPNGRVSVRWPGEEVRTFMGTATSLTGVWDLQIIDDPLLDPITIVAGKWKATQDVTRP